MPRVIPSWARPFDARSDGAVKYVQVWRFSLYYVVVFGTDAALSVAAQLLCEHLRRHAADGIAVDGAFIFPASLFCPLGGWLSDLYGPRAVTYAVFIGMTLATLLLCLPGSILPLDVWSFTVLLFVVAVGMGIGKASVYKYIPNYYPNDVGAPLAGWSVCWRIWRLLTAQNVWLARPGNYLSAVGIPGTVGDHGRQPRLAAPGR